MAKHVHQWRCTECFMLTLPTDLGYCDRVMVWTCENCTKYAEVAGHIQVGYPVKTPEFWDQIQAEAVRARRGQHG